MAHPAGRHAPWGAAVAETRYLVGNPARGLLLGLGLSQLAGVVVGLALGGLALASRLPLPVALLPVVAAGGWSWAGVGDRRLHEWAAPAWRYASGWLGGRTWRGALPGVAVGGGWAGATLPPELEGLRFGEVCVDGLRVGVAVEGRRAGRRATAVLALRGPEGFGLAEAEEQAAHVAGWARVLSALGVDGKDLLRLCWVARAEPGVAPLRVPAEDAGEDARAGARADYGALVSHVAAGSVRHHVYLGIQVEATGKGGLSEAAGTESRRVAQLLAGAGIGTRPLGRRELVDLIGSWADPARGLALPAAKTGPDTGAVMTGRKLGWSHLRADGAFHRSWVVTAWPRVPVGPPWLEPLLAAVPPGAARSFAVHLRAVPTDLAARRARAGRLNARLDQAQRTRWGFDEGARQTAELAEAERREEELVSGYAAHRVVAVLSVSARDLVALDEAARAVEQAARGAGVEIRCCYGSQGEAWAASLPLCRVREARGR